MNNVEGKSYRATFTPLYLAIDVSGSMDNMVSDGETCLDKLNNLVPAITKACLQYPVLAEKLRLSIITFSDDAKVVLSLCDSETFQYAPQLITEGSTNYTSLFHVLKAEIGFCARAEPVFH